MGPRISTLAPPYGRPSPRRRSGRGAPLRKAPSLLVSCLAVFAVTFGVGIVLPPLLGPLLETNGQPSRAASVVVTRVIDGDTFVLSDGEHIRIENIDTAEMPPRSRCPYEQTMALAARARLGELIRSGGPVTLHRGLRDRDVYDRLLRRVMVAGRDVGDQLVAEGLAQRWMGHKASWCQ